MLKYSTGRSKPGWGKMECRPVWWPDDVPWANVRSDVRTTEQKKKVDYYLQVFLRSKISHCRNSSKKYHTAGTVPKSNRNITLSEQFQIPIEISHCWNSSKIQ